MNLTRGSGAAVFAGGGAWLPRGYKTTASCRGDEAVLLSDPCRITVATTPGEVPALLAEVDAQQRRGRFVAGYLAYEAGVAFGLKVRPPAPDALPLGWMAAYAPESVEMVPADEWRAQLDAFDVSRVRDALAGVTPELSVSREEYVDAIGRVREFIAAGDTYQVNYTVRARYELAPSGAPTGATAGATPDPIDPLDYFLALVIRQAVPYAAYLDLGDAQIISLSPEMFLRRDGDRLESRPMKGTRPRGTTHAEDVALAYELAETEKERAENLMIVDMVRNDLGRVCRAGSVRVPTLNAVEPYRTVWQMVSTVTGKMHPGAGVAEIMPAVFPGASITGAPKHHTMEIIAALETEPRDVYTGTVGLFCPGGDFTGNIAIRTIIHRRGHCQLGTGSGVVWDAEPGAEYEETLAKAAFATPPKSDSWRPDRAASLHEAVHGTDRLRLFETILLEAREGDATIEIPGGLAGLSPSLDLSDAAVLARYVFLDDHLDRMASSAEALGFAFDRQPLQDLLIGQARLSPGALVVHIDLDIDGCFSVSTRNVPAPEAEAPAALMVSPFRTDPDNPLLRHKTGVRGFYNRERRRALHAGCFDALFLNRLDRVTEGAITNLFARFDGSWVTPPLEDGLLAGIWRARFLAGKGAVEASLTLDDLCAADEIVVGNSVRGAVCIDRLTVDPLVF
ncbi:MAG: aminodeoxychorismate synthase, component I [Actinobacteria bacterium RBG_16_64_13]|nr:MAG: aminodeoxychorismate synthase, component I [Actinobacteria bacterium RBG_16_64_13]